MKKIYSSEIRKKQLREDQSELNKTSWSFSLESGSPKAIQGFLNAAISAAIGSDSAIITKASYDRVLSAFHDMHNIISIYVPKKIFHPTTGEVLWDVRKDVIFSESDDYLAYLSSGFTPNSFISNDITSSPLAPDLSFEEFKSLFSSFSLGSNHYTHFHFKYWYLNNGNPERHDSYKVTTLCNPSETELKVMYQWYLDMKANPRLVMSTSLIDQVSSKTGFNHQKKTFLAYNTLMIFSLMVSYGINNPLELKLRHFNYSEDTYFLEIYSNNDLPSNNVDTLGYIYRNRRIGRYSYFDFDKLFSIEKIWGDHTGASVLDYFTLGPHQQINRDMGTSNVFYYFYAISNQQPYWDETPLVGSHMFTGRDANKQEMVYLSSNISFMSRDIKKTTNPRLLAARQTGVSTSGVVYTEVSNSLWDKKLLTPAKTVDYVDVFPTNNLYDYLSSNGDISSIDVVRSNFKDEYIKQVEDYMTEDPVYQTTLRTTVDNFDLRTYDVFKTINKTPPSDAIQKAGDIAFNNVVNSVNLRVNEINEASKTVLDTVEKVESTLAGLSLQASNLSSPNEANSAASLMQDLVLEFGDSLEEISKEFGFKIDKNEFTNFSDKFIQSQMKANVFKQQYSKWMYSQLEFLNDFKEDFITRYKVRNQIIVPVSNDILNQIEVVNDSVERAVDKMDLYIPSIDVSWVSNLLLNMIGSLALNVLQTLSIVDNIFSIMEKWDLNFTVNANFVPFTVEGVTGKQFALAALPVRSTFSSNIDNSKFLLNSSQQRSFICSNLVTKEDLLYYVVEVTDIDSIMRILRSTMNDASKFVSIISDRDVNLCSMPEPIVVDAAAKATMAQAALASAAAIASASGWAGKAIAGALAFAATVALNVVGEITWKNKRRGREDIKDYIISDSSRSVDIPSTSDYIILNNFNHLLMTRSSNARFALGILKDVVSIGLGVVGTTAMGYVIGSVQSIVKNFQTKRKLIKSMNQQDTILVAGTPMKVKDLDWTQKRMLASNAINSNKSPAAIVSAINPNIAGDDKDNLSRYIQEIREDMSSVRGFFDSDKLTNIENSNNQILEALGGIGKISADMALQSLLLNRINRKLGF